MHLNRGGAGGSGQTEKNKQKLTNKPRFVHNLQDQCNRTEKNTFGFLKIWASILRINYTFTCTD